LGSHKRKCGSKTAKAKIFCRNQKRKKKSIKTTTKKPRTNKQTKKPR
jgi:hypothetical protein